MFGCTKCGACCRRIDDAVANAGFVAELFEINVDDLKFPYQWDEKGVCEKLIDNRCSVYDNRPLICNVDKLRELSGIEEKEFYDFVKMACHELMVAEGIYNEYKIL